MGSEVTAESLRSELREEPGARFDGELGASRGGSGSRKRVQRACLRNWWSEYCEVSTRALSLWRISLGLTALANTLYYWRSADVFYAPDGVLPPRLLSLWSPLLLFESSWQFDLFFATTAAACLALALGISGAKWIVPLLTAAYFQRGHMIVTGGHAVLQLSMVLAWFLPVTENWSVESLRKSGSLSGEERIVRNLGYPLALLQLSINYGFNTVNKLTETWLDGSAVSRALANPMTSKSLGQLLSGSPGWLLEGATYGTLIVEGSLPLLLLFPFLRRITHPMAAALMLGLHGTIVLTMEVGLFGWAMLCQIPLLLFWLTPHRRRELPLMRPKGAAVIGRRVGALAMLYAIFLSLGDPANRAGVARGAERDLLPELPLAKAFTQYLNLVQGWGMFSHPLSKSYVAITHAQTAGGQTFDPWRYRAADDAEAHDRLPREAYRRHVFSSYESLILVSQRETGPFGQWVMRQTPPWAPNDPVQRFATWTLNVPAEKRYVVSDAEVRKVAGVYPLPLASPLPVRLESFGVWQPERIVDGEIVQEGSHVQRPTGAALTPNCAYVTLHLRQPSNVRQVFIQSDAFDRFLIEGTQDGHRFAKLGESEQIVKRQYRSRLVDVDGKALIAVRLRKLNPRPLTGFLNEVALFDGRQKLPPLPEQPEGQMLANFERPAAMGLADDIRGGCPWERVANQ